MVEPMTHLKIFYIFAELNKKIIKEFSIQVFAHLIQNEPISDGTMVYVRLDSNGILLVLEVPKTNKT